MASAEKTEYLWAAHAGLARGLDNVRIAGQTLEDAINDLRRTAELYEFPEGSEPGDIVEKGGAMLEQLRELVSDGAAKSALFREKLMQQENP